MEVKSKIQQLFTVNRPRAQNMPSQAHVSSQSSISLDRKDPNSSRYIFYQAKQPNKYQQLPSSKVNSQQYKYVNEHLQDIRKKSQSQVESNVPSRDSYRVQNNKEVAVGQNKNFSPFKKIQRQDSAVNQTLQFSSNSRYLKKSNSAVGQLTKRISEFNKDLPRFESTQMVESTILRQGSDVQQVESNQKYLLSDNSRLLCQSNVSSQMNQTYSSLKEDPVRVREKMGELEKECRNLEKRNFQLAQEIVLSETTIRNKQMEMEGSIKKSEDSLKISRNIITGLNQKMTKTQKNHESILNQMRSSHENVIASKQEELQSLKATNFEQQLRIIDLTHEIQGLTKRQSDLRQHFEAQISIVKQEKDKQISILSNKSIESAEVQGKMYGDLVRLDEFNVKLDQEIQRLLGIIANKDEQIQEKINERHNLVEQFEHEKIQEMKSLEELLRKEQFKGRQLLEKQLMEEKSEKKQLLEQFKQEKLKERKIFEKQFKEEKDKEIQRLLAIIAVKDEKIKEKLQEKLNMVQQFGQEKIKEKQLVQQLREEKLKEREVFEKQFKEEKDKEIQNLLAIIADKNEKLPEKLQEKHNIVEQFGQEKIKEKKSFEEQKTKQKQFLEKLKEEKLQQIQLLETKFRQEKLRDRQLIEKQFREEKNKEKQLFEDKVEEKDGKISELNIQLTNLQLQILEKKQTLKKNQQQASDKIKTYQGQILVAKKNILELQEKVIELETAKNCQEQRQKEAQKLQVTEMKCLKCQEYEESIIQKDAEAEKLTEQLSHYLDDDLTILSLERQNQLLQEEVEDLAKQNEELKIELYERKLNESQEMVLLRQKIDELEEEKVEVKEYIEEIRKLYRESSEVSQQMEQVNQQGSDMKIRSKNMSFCSQKKPRKTDEDVSIGLYSPKSEPQTMQEWLQNIQCYQREDITLKIHELIFLNKSLTMKVEQINELQQNQNTMIIEKLKIFGDSIEKYQLDISELEQRNRMNQIEIGQWADKCLFYEGRVQLMDVRYKELELSLFEVTEDMLRVQAQFANWRFSKGRQGEEGEWCASVKGFSSQKKVEEGSEQDWEDVESGSDSEDCEEPQYEIRVNQIDSEDSETEVVDIMSKINRKLMVQYEAVEEEGDIDFEGLITEEDVIWAESPVSSKQRSVDSPQSKEKEQTINRMKEEMPMLTEEDIEEIIMKQMMMAEEQYHYEVEDLTEEVAQYAIFVSHVDSDEEVYEPQFQAVEMEEQGIEMSLGEIDMNLGVEIQEPGEQEMGSGVLEGQVEPELGGEFQSQSKDVEPQEVEEQTA